MSSQPYFCDPSFDDQLDIFANRSSFLFRLQTNFRGIRFQLKDMGDW